jgi:hypothetical protein
LEAISTILKDGTSTKTFDALDWLAQLATHIPNNEDEQLVKKILKSRRKQDGMSSANRLREPMARQLKP